MEKDEQERKQQEKMQKAKEKQMLNERAKQRASMRTKRYTYDFKGTIMYLNKFQKDKLPPS